MYKCYYCGIKESPLQSIIEHCKLSHGEATLKYRQLVLDENTGIQRYQTKIYEGVVPSNLTKYGKFITVNDGLTCILDKESNKKKLNTPVNKGNNKITELRTILQRESQNS
jgi:RecJ-like exonuclease